LDDEENRGPRRGSFTSGQGFKQFEERVTKSLPVTKKLSRGYR
jgi:hypothetical protein